MSLSSSAPPTAAGAASPGASASIDVATTPPTITATTADGALASTSPSFSTLPMGPLSMAALYLTESDVAQLLRTDKEMANMNSGEVASDNFWRERCCTTFGGHADYIEPLGKDAFRAFLTAKRRLSEKSKRKWPHLLSGGERFDRLRCTDELLDRCAGASSQDRDDEDPANTLHPSPCATIMQFARMSQGKRSQSECGCVHFLKCYWSSEPSPVADKDEWLDYSMTDGLAVVTSFVLTPYTSFWQPNAPTYNPVEAYFQLSHPRINGGKQPYYESPRFRVKGLMKRQQFELPRPILSLGGTARVVLSGMAQRQTLPADAGETANHYHICISYVALIGAVLLSCSVADGAAERPSGRSSSDDDAEGVEPGNQEFTDGLKILAEVKKGDEPSAVTKTANPEDSTRVIAGLVRKQPQGVLRLRWVVFVYVHTPVASSSSPVDGGERGVDGEQGGPAVCDKSFCTIKAHSDTLCAEFLELYAQQVRRPMKLEDERLELVVSGGPRGDRALPSDVGSGAVLGDFASEDRLDLVDASLSGRRFEMFLAGGVDVAIGVCPKMSHSRHDANLHPT